MIRTSHCSRRAPARHALLIAAVLLAGLALEVAGQIPERPRDEVLSALFSSLEPETDLRLVTIGGVVEEGALQGVGPESFDLAWGGETHEIGYGFVRSVSVEEGHGLQGALWGAGGGALAGSFFGMMYASFDCRTAADCNFTEKEGAWRGGFLFGAIGAAVGYFLGSRNVHWHPIFP